MVPLRPGDIVMANERVEEQDQIDYFPASNVTKGTTLDSHGNPIPIQAGMLGYVYTPYRDYPVGLADSDEKKEKVEMCLVDFTQWGDCPENDKIISATLPSSFLNLETRFETGDIVAAKKIVEYRMDKLEYSSLSTTPGETPLALLEEGLEAIVVDPDCFLDLDFSFQLQEEDMREDPDPQINLSLGDTLILLVSLPPTFVELVESVKDHQGDD